jgi:hypothetical protein
VIYAPKIKILCTTKLGDKQSCEVSLKSLPPPAALEMKHIQAYQKIDHLKLITVHQKIQVENPDIMRNMATNK